MTKTISMDITIEKSNILNWIQNLEDKNVLKKILEIKAKNEISKVENELIQKGLNDLANGNVSTHEEVKEHFKRKFSK